MAGRLASPEISEFFEATSQEGVLRYKNSEIWATAEICLELGGLGLEAEDRIVEI